MIGRRTQRPRRNAHGIAFVAAIVQTTRAPDRRLGIGVVVITLALGVLFPLLGISIVALLIFDFVVVKHIPPLRRALGAA